MTNASCSMSFDVAVMERADRGAMLPLNAGSSDAALAIRIVAI